MQAVYFSDFRLIKGFVDACTADIKKNKCGRIEEKDEEVCTCNLEKVYTYVHVM